MIGTVLAQARDPVFSSWRIAGISLSSNLSLKMSVIARIRFVGVLVQCKSSKSRTSSSNGYPYPCAYVGLLNTNLCTVAEPHVLIPCVCFVVHAVYTYMSAPARREYTVHLKVKGG